MPKCPCYRMLLVQRCTEELFLSTRCRDLSDLELGQVSSLGAVHKIDNEGNVYRPFAELLLKESSYCSILTETNLFTGGRSCLTLRKSSASFVTPAVKCTATTV